MFASQYTANEQIVPLAYHTIEKPNLSFDAF